MLVKWKMEINSILKTLTPFTLNTIQLINRELLDFDPML